MEITSHMTGWKAILAFHSCGWFGKDLHRIDGYIQDDKKKKQRAFCGNWLDSFYSFNISQWDEYLKQYKNHQSKNTSMLQNTVAGDSDTSSPSSSTASFHKTQSDPSMNLDLVPEDKPKVKLEKCRYNLDGLTLLWKPFPRPPNHSKYYSFTYFAMQLNEMPEDVSHLPPTDCRFRPDMHEASFEKNRLEEKQRAARKEMKKLNKEPEPV
ncbi:hypothetical protein HELRODRAFT_164847 [Helobdella robusta]|uniref:Uncharacterized protein n=1 Tax=Helobdella robusta TaxID=6412 RepID=T1EVV9_HELRO|nr:hypothetical protein HELRODRAFT_164847 [Helobdella robusta]ESN92747.1 hypothetical protein HELRODRAFT_164847 [Helobdella robusta]